jgi:putative membrane protein insertion efficiency factor
MLLSVSSLAQSLSHLNFVLEKYSEQETVAQPNVEPVVNNEIKTAGLFLIRSYQILLSSQDRPACLFSTSCSRFGMAALKKKGFLVGICLTADRLQRCNELARRNYAADPANGLAIDPMLEFILHDK